jgi:hypothetical protein
MVHFSLIDLDKSTVAVWVIKGKIWLISSKAKAYQLSVSKLRLYTIKTKGILGKTQCLGVLRRYISYKWIFLFKASKYTRPFKAVFSILWDMLLMIWDNKMQLTLVWARNRINIKELWVDDTISINFLTCLELKHHQNNKPML